MSDIQPPDAQSVQGKLVLGGQLAEALARNGLHVLYQPIAEVISGQVIGAEALVGWDHEELGTIPAVEVMSIAIETGLSGEITDFVLRAACAEAAKWRKGGVPIGLFVNLWGGDLSVPRLVGTVSRHLDTNGLPASALTLEVTPAWPLSYPGQQAGDAHGAHGREVGDLDAASRVLGEFRALGVRVALDNFGTGFSSLHHVSDLPLTDLKIHRSFVDGLATYSHDAAIVEGTVDLAHRFGLHVVAEGAENELTCAVLADAQCDALQGDYLSPPLPSAELRAWLATRPRLQFSRSSRV